MFPSFKCQILCFCFKFEFASLTQLSRQQVQFSKIRFCYFLVYMTKYRHKKKFTKLILRKMHYRWTDRQTNGRIVKIFQIVT